MEKIKTDEIVKLLVSEWKKLAIVAAIAIVLGSIISSPLIIKPLYKSTAIVYPVNLSPSSEESNTEQLLQYLHSEEIKDALAKKFDLYNHYGIDLENKQKDFLLGGIFKERVSIESTLYESVEITVKDELPETAQKMAQAIIDEGNNLISSIRKQRLQEYIDNSEYAYVNEIRKVDSVKTIINKFKADYNIVNLEQQSKQLAKKIVKSGSLSEQDLKTAEIIKTKETDFSKQQTVLASEIGTYNYYRNEVNKFGNEKNSNISYTNIVSKPTLSDRKCYPIRSVVVALITLSALLMACLYIILSHYNKKESLA